MGTQGTQKLSETTLQVYQRQNPTWVFLISNPRQSSRTYKHMNQPAFTKKKKKSSDHILVSAQSLGLDMHIYI